MEKTIYTYEEIKFLIERFETRKLPKIEWTHPAHLVVAIWYSSKHEHDEALKLTREFITKHNESVGTMNSDEEGYHETITKFWLCIADQFLNDKRNLSIEQNCNKFISSPLGQSSYPLNYYSKEVLFSVQARHHWIEPNLKILSELNL